MKKQIITITLGILMIASALAMFSGESITFETELKNPVYTVYDNSSNLDGLNVVFENRNITITTDPMMESDNFTLVFFDEQTKEIVKTVYSGGGGGSGSYTKYIDRNVTVYVPEYINDTKTIEVEKKVDKIVEIDSGIPLKTKAIIICCFLGLIILGLIIYNLKPYEQMDLVEEEPQSL